MTLHPEINLVQRRVMQYQMQSSRRINGQLKISKMEVHEHVEPIVIGSSGPHTD